MRPPIGVHERGLDEALWYFVFADAFGWTPQQVDDQPVLLIEGMADIFAARAEVRAARTPTAPAPPQPRRR